MATLLLVVIIFHFDLLNLVDLVDVGLGSLRLSLACGGFIASRVSGTTRIYKLRHARFRAAYRGGAQEGTGTDAEWQRVGRWCAFASRVDAAVSAGFNSDTSSTGG